MIITRTPFRVSLVGGGTDLPEFYWRQAGAVVGMAINKYMYIIVNKRFDETIRVSYTQTEIVDKVEDIQHEIVKEALKTVGITSSIEIVSIADIPAGTGLGSSSSFTVGLLNALYAFKGIVKSSEELAKEASHIEIDLLKEPIGKQDQYLVACGGLRYVQFNPDESVFSEPILYSKENQRLLRRNLLLFYVGGIRKAGNILIEQKANMEQTGKIEALTKMRDQAFELRGKLNNGSSPDILGEYLKQGWLLKKQLASGISNGWINECYEKAIKAGAAGGKVLGAGGGGFLLIYCPKENQPRVKEALNELVLTSFSVDNEGSRIIYVT